jgi:PAS domain-containing protein
VYHRDHGVPIASSSSPGLSEDAVAADGQITVRHIADEVHACVWSEIVDVEEGFVLLLNSDHVCVFASEGVRETFGCAPSTLVGTRPDSRLDADQLPQVWRTRAAVAAGARHVLTRVRWSAREGRPRWFDTSSSVVRDPGTGAEYTAIHGRDVTHEMELQTALSRSEQRHATLLDAVEHAVLQLDVALRIASFNQQALALLGRAADQLLGRNAFSAVDLRDEDGRAVTEPAHPAIGGPARGGRDDAWCTVADADGHRTLVLARLASYPGSRPDDAGHLLILREAGGLGATPMAPSREQARAAAGLTAREGDVLDGLAAGGDVPTVARWLGISVHSVRGHVKSITAKLGVHSQLQAVITATRRGMVDLSEEPRRPLGGSSSPNGTSGTSGASGLPDA